MKDQTCISEKKKKKRKNKPFTWVVVCGEREGDETGKRSCDGGVGGKVNRETLETAAESKKLNLRLLQLILALSFEQLIFR